MRLLLESPYLRLLPATFLGAASSYVILTLIHGKQPGVGNVIFYSVVAYAILSFWAWSRQANAAKKPLLPNLAAYLAPPDLREATEIGPRIKGKIALVDENVRDISTWQMKLPPELRATRPDEVGTIIWVKERKEKVGEYVYSFSLPGAAYAYVWDLTIIDKSIPAVVGRASIRGSDPPATAYDGGDESGARPLSETMSYLRSLPRR